MSANLKALSDVREQIADLEAHQIRLVKQREALEIQKRNLEAQEQGRDFIERMNDLENAIKQGVRSFFKSIDVSEEEYVLNFTKNLCNYDQSYFTYSFTARYDLSDDFQIVFSSPETFFYKTLRNEQCVDLYLTLHYKNKIKDYSKQEIDGEEYRFDGVESFFGNGDPYYRDNGFYFASEGFDPHDSKNLSELMNELWTNLHQEMKTEIAARVAFHQEEIVRLKNFKRDLGPCFKEIQNKIPPTSERW